MTPENATEALGVSALLWEPAGNAPFDVEVLAKWGTATGGAYGYVVAIRRPRKWVVSMGGERLDDEGFEVLEFAKLPEL